jgi:prepilin-type N-terminal cleavage/methylation domain-containing protein
MIVAKSQLQPALHRFGFTLIELVLSISIIAVILLGLQSAMVLASGSNRSSAGQLSLNSGRAVDLLSADLSCATSILSSSATSIQCIVPDRTGDNSPETISYSWSGVSGDPLLRSINGGASTTILSGVNEFQLTYDKRSQQRAASYTESGEILLASNSGGSFLNLGDWDVRQSNWIGQYFRPSLPASASRWRVTRLLIPARIHGWANGAARIQIRTVNSSGFPGVVLDECTMQENTLTSYYTWQQFSFTNVAGRAPGTGLCIVAQWVSDSDACDIQYQALMGVGINAYLVTSVNGGATWGAPFQQQLIYYVYGTYSTTDPVANDYWLTGVRCTLSSGSDTAGRVVTTIRTINEPQVSGP